ncbi:MAG: DEAD/DEAH box helicase family protein [Candidatus Kapabacteria bacterium]|nr:DEAD/DEAH box helicase family protein [Candidatus Kapabacteria bacterium]
MAKRKKVVALKKDEINFYEYLLFFYHSNKKRIKKEYKLLTKKFLDFNDPKEKSGAFLRPPQFEALEIYVFLKEFLDNQKLHNIFDDWYNGKNKFEGRELVHIKGDTVGLFNQIDADLFKQAFDDLKSKELPYPNFIFALTMGIGKTILMATSIFYEFLLANKYPKDNKYCHNALVFAPDRTVLQSLKEIMTFDKSKVVPPEYVNWIETNLKFHFLDDSGSSLNILEQSDFNIIISNTQKIILKKQHKKGNVVSKLFSDNKELHQAIEANKEFDDLYDFEPEEERELLTNQRFQKLLRVNQLGIYVDEAHHAFGNTLERSLTSLRQTINELSLSLEKANTQVVACFNYTGTPYVKNRLLPEVVYAYGLKDAIQKGYLKRAVVNGYTNSKSKEFLKIVIDDFWNYYSENRYEGLLPKIAFFASSIEELEKELKPNIEGILSEKNIPMDKILVNVGDEKITSNDDIREFNNLDKPSSDKQFILLVNKGKEGWNCRSLFAVALHRQPKSKIFVLQATMRCLRQITEIQETARVYLSDDNRQILDNELEENFRMAVGDLDVNTDNKVTVQVKLLEPRVKVPLKSIKKLHTLKEKSINYSDKVDFGMASLDKEKYKIIKTQRSITNFEKKIGIPEDLSKYRENRIFSRITLNAEIARYLNINPITIDKLLTNSIDEYDLLLKSVNEFNDIIYDIIIPKLFNTIFEIKEFEHIEEREIELVKWPPANGSDAYMFRVKPELLIKSEDYKLTELISKSFHLDNYCFDSIPELSFFKNALNDNNLDKVYFTGMLTHGQSDFCVSYIDPESHTLKNYYPDFLIVRNDGSYVIIEVKADVDIDTSIVRAKTDYANKIATASGMSYIMMPSSKTSSFFQLTKSEA